MNHYTIECAQDEDGADRWFVADSDADWVGGPYATRELAADAREVLNRMTARTDAELDCAS
jgi:hypothetical protein